VGTGAKAKPNVVWVSGRKVKEKVAKEKARGGIIIAPLED